MSLTLYHSPGACSMAVYISLLEAGADFDVEIVSLAKGEQMSEAFGKLNPKRKVPFLVTDGAGLSENVAIQTWIAETYPNAKLMPTDTLARAKAISYMGWFGSGLHPHMTRHFKTIKFCGHEEAHPDIKEKAKAMYLDQIALLDDVLANRTWFFDAYTVCDSYFFWIYNRAVREGFDMTVFENATAHNERMMQRASVKQVLAHTA